MNIRRSAIPLVSGVLWSFSASAGLVTITAPDSPGLPGSSQSRGLSAQLWTGSIDTLAQAQSLMSSRSADGTFTSTMLHYPGDADVVSTTAAFKTFLGADYASYHGTAPTKANNFLIKLTGEIYIPVADTYTFAVSSDDGFSLNIGGKVVTSFTTDRTYYSSSGQAKFTSAGLYSIEIVYWASRADDSGLSVTSNIAKAYGLPDYEFDPLSTANLFQRMTVPAPATALVGTTGVLGFGSRRRRR